MGRRRSGAFPSIISQAAPCVASHYSLDSIWQPHHRNRMRQATTSDEFLDAQAKLLEAYRAQSDSHFVDLSEPALHTHYLESGQGDAVLMIHGGNSFAASWAPLIEPLSREFHLYLPDRPGCGLTDKVDYRGVPFRKHSVAFVRSLLDRIGIKRVSIVGSSMGGYFAFAFALAHPERVVKIAVIGAAPLINDAMPVPHRQPSSCSWLESIHLVPTFGKTGTATSLIRATREALAGRSGRAPGLGAACPEP